MQKGEAIPFILIHEKHNSKSRYTFELHNKAIELFHSLKNKQICVASVAGPQRTGKSFLSNRLLKRMNGFAIGPSTLPCTKGLWIWGEPVQIDKDTVLIIMDTEGLNSVQRDVNLDLKIFALAILLSSVFIYNSIGHIDQKALENMSYVLKVSESLRMKAQGDTESQLAKMFPIFYWVLRDFSLDLKGMSEKEYLQSCLKPISNDPKDVKNQIRSKIRKLFQQRWCECFPRPVNEEDRLAHIEQLQYSELREKFRDKLESFERRFYETLPSKSINGKPVTGKLYIDMVQEYLNAFNNGKIPEVMNSLERVLQNEVKAISQSVITRYREDMSKLCHNDEPVDESQLQYHHRQFIKKIAQKLNEKFQNWAEIGKVAEYKSKLLDFLEKQFREKTKHNTMLAEAQCNQEFLRLQKAMALPEIKKVTDVSQSLVEQKFTEFNKFTNEFKDKCKAPVKYTYFFKSFPKFIFDYFNRTISRIKGAYNTQIQELTLQAKTFQKHSEGYKNLMQHQDNLLAEREKQIETITRDRDNIKRELGKIQKLKEFSEETENMKKSQIKKQLEAYKAQMIELEERNKQLEQLLNKAKHEVSFKKSELSILSKKANMEVTDVEENQSLPNSLVSGLKELNQKLKHVRAYYESKIVEDPLNDNTLKEIERIRSEKHQAIERKNEELQIKKQQARKQINKIKEEYEKKIQLVNSHTDDIKAENIQLEQRLKDSPYNQQKMKNFVNQRKQFQQSLRLKQNNIDSLNLLSNQKEKKLERMRADINKLEEELALMRGQKANFDSYKESFTFILRQSLKWIQNKNNKLKHSVGTLTKEDLAMVKLVFKELNLEPF